MVSVQINNQTVQIPKGATILDAAKKAGIRIPTLCHLEGIEPKGACRVCLVEVENAKTLMASCSTPAAEGMKIHTNETRPGRQTHVVEL
jgi:NADH dehydrogenase/NADH:ubiquinone oxidoreductase subunit G